MQLPLISRFQRQLPPEGKPWNKADNFCLIVRKHDEARGRRVAADNFANFFARKMSKDKA